MGEIIRGGKDVVTGVLEASLNLNAKGKDRGCEEG